MNPVDLIERWRKILGLKGWKLRLREEPPPLPAKHSAFSETTFSEREALLWVKTEPEVIHEELHVLLSSLHDVFWRAERDKSLDALWARREEQIVTRLEKAFVRVMRG